MELLVKIIDEISKLLDLWTNNTSLRDIALRPTKVLPALLPQKPSETSRANHLKALERRLRLWEERKITKLMKESKTKQERLPATKTQINIGKLS